MKLNTRMSLHALHRSQHRGVPQRVIDTILEYGQRRRCKGGAYTYFLDKTSMGQIKSELGAAFASGMAAFRTAYVVVGEGQVVTVAFARTPAAANYWRRKP